MSKVFPHSAAPISRTASTRLAARSSTMMKAAMTVLLTSAFVLLPTARAEDVDADKAQGAQLSKGEIKAQQQFKMLDFNHDGKLSRKEVAIIPKLAAAFDETDTNKDGFVTYEEVRAFAVKYRAARESAKAAEVAKSAKTQPEHHAPAPDSEADSADAAKN
ncbi:MAG: EF-hand domain-containing protein [Comamonas sp.]